MTSSLVLQELLETSSPAFLERVLATRTPVDLVAIGHRWVADARPWARAQLEAYVVDGCDRPSHPVLVKLLLRHAESARDVELVAWLAVAFDRLLAHKLVMRTVWNVELREAQRQRSRKLLTAAPFRTRRILRTWDRKLRRHVRSGTELAADTTTFSVVTRRYLQRRIVRTLRTWARSDVMRFREATARVWQRTANDVASDAARLLDARTFMELCFHDAPALRRRSHRFDVVTGRTLGDLQPAPLARDAWLALEAQPHLLRTVAQAPSLIARRTAGHLLATHTVSAQALQPLVTSSHADARALGAQLLARAPDLDSLLPRTWLALLHAADPETASLLADVAVRHLRVELLDDSALLGLAKSACAPVAMLAGEALVARNAPRAVLWQLAQVDVERARAVVRVAVGALCEHDGTLEELRDLCDATHDDVRALACDVIARTERFRDDPLVWSALAESPFDDVRNFFAHHVQHRAAALPADTLARMWAHTLLTTWGNGRTKRRVLLDVVERAVTHDDERGSLLSLLSIALRSVRTGERTAALTALVRGAHVSTSLRDAIAVHFPELTLAHDVTEVHA
jgi:hypothetical protein